MNNSYWDLTNLEIYSPEKIKHYSYGKITDPMFFSNEKKLIFLKYKNTQDIKDKYINYIKLTSPLFVPISKNYLSIIACLLDTTEQIIIDILQYNSFVITNPKNTPLKKGKFLSSRKYYELSEKYNYGFEAYNGAEAIRLLLEELNIEKEIDELKIKISNISNISNIKNIEKRLEILKYFSEQNLKPEWMILTLIPIVPFKNRAFASELDNIYIQIIYTNDRLERLLELNAPSIIIRGEKTKLNKLVNNLINQKTIENFSKLKYNVFELTNKLINDNPKSEEEIVLDLYIKNEDNLENVIECFNNDKNVMKAIVKMNGLNLELMSTNLKNDKDVVLEAIKNNVNAILFASDNLKDDKDIILEAVKNNGFALQYASNDLKNDKDVVLEAVKNNGLALRYASDKLKDDYDVVLNAVKNNELSLQYASKNLKFNQNIALVAVKNNNFAIKYVDENIINDEYIFLERVKNNIYHFVLANNEIKNNKNIVLFVVKKDGIMLKYASQNLQSDKDVVLEAVKNNGLALQYASNDLKNNKDIVNEAIKNNKNALHYASDNLKEFYREITQ